MGLTPVRKALQKDGIDDKLRNQLWNIYYDTFISRFEDQLNSGEEDKASNMYLKILWEDFFCERIDEFPQEYKLFRHIKHFFLKCEWYELYNFIQFTISRYNTSKKMDANWIIHYTYFTNKILDKHLSAYRIIGKNICPITSEIEIESIEKALENDGEYKVVKTHLNDALKLLSDKKQPDYENSIKESISAIESLCKIILNDNNITLGKGINKLQNLHPALTSALTQLYRYTNKAGGIRHAHTNDDHEVNFEEAKLMLVSCSAFVNYLIQKQANTPTEEVTIKATSN